MCSVAKRTAGFRSQACIWKSSETLEPCFIVFSSGICLERKIHAQEDELSIISNHMPGESTDENTAQTVYG